MEQILKNAIKRGQKSLSEHESKAVIKSAGVAITSEKLVGIGELALRHSEIAEIDINPLIIAGNKPVAADALVILAG